MNKNDTRVSFYMVLASLIVVATMMHPTFGSVFVGAINAGLLFVLRWRAQEEGRAEVEKLVEAVQRNDAAKEKAVG